MNNIATHSRAFGLVLQCALMCGLFAAGPDVLAEGHIRGSCMVGESELAHGLSDPQAVQQIRDSARLYATRFKQFRESEFDMRRSINELLELKEWTQDDIIAFTLLQRRLLYLSVGRQLATGRVTIDELPGYAVTIRERITEIEVELGCDILPDA